MIVIIHRLIIKKQTKKKGGETNQAKGAIGKRFSNETFKCKNQILISFFFSLLITRLNKKIFIFSLIEKFITLDWIYL
jgi:hypothetical protein